MDYQLSRGVILCVSITLFLMRLPNKERNMLQTCGLEVQEHGTTLARKTTHKGLPARATHAAPIFSTVFADLFHVDVDFSNFSWLSCCFGSFLAFSIVFLRFFSNMFLVCLIGWLILYCFTLFVDWSPDISIWSFFVWLELLPISIYLSCCCDPTPWWQKETEHPADMISCDCTAGRLSR